MITITIIINNNPDIYTHRLVDYLQYSDPSKDNYCLCHVVHDDESVNAVNNNNTHTQYLLSVVRTMPRWQRRRRRRPRAVNLSPSVTDELVNEKEKYKNIADEMDQAFSELSGF